MLYMYIHTYMYHILQDAGSNAFPICWHQTVLTSASQKCLSTHHAITPEDATFSMCITSCQLALPEFHDSFLRYCHTQEQVWGVFFVVRWTALQKDYDIFHNTSILPNKGTGKKWSDVHPYIQNSAGKAKTMLSQVKVCVCVHCVSVCSYACMHMYRCT